MKHQFKIYDGDCIVTYDRTPEKDAEIVDRLLEWYKKVSAVSGECIMQSDTPQLEAAPLLADLADDVFKFETEYV